MDEDGSSWMARGDVSLEVERLPCYDDKTHCAQVSLDEQSTETDYSDVASESLISAHAIIELPR